ncbi:hypothetical protein Leryth_012471 [Lithospermum erythrorhizon]|nr:hypothetical protein Leryth_012471 [Lithospermum erythrorhizon]
MKRNENPSSYYEIQYTRKAKCRVVGRKVTTSSRRSKNDANNEDYVSNFCVTILIMATEYLVHLFMVIRDINFLNCLLCSYDVLLA